MSGCLAKEVAKTASGVYVIKLNENAKWSDGSSFTSKDVKYTIDLIKSAYNLYSENVKYISLVETIDDTTLKITLTEDVPFFEYNLIFPIMCESYYAGEDFFSSSKTPIGTGRYVINNIAENQITLSKNSNYYNTQKINQNIENIYINLYSEIGEVYNSFKLGNIDVLSTSNILYKNYIGTLGYYVKEYSGREYDFLACNCNDYIMKDQSVRQAINCAIDKDNIVSNVFYNEYYKSNYLLDYGSYLYSNDSNQTQHNIELAKEALSNGGWHYSNNRWYKNGWLLTFTITVSASNSQRYQAAHLIKSQLESIGMVVYVNEVSDAQYTSCLQNKNYQLILTGVYNGYNPDVSYLYADGNIANYTNENINVLINETKNITDSKLLTSKYEEILRYCYE